MARMLIFVTVLLILNSSLCAEQVQVPPTDIQTINTLGTVEIPSLRGNETCKATISVNDRYKQKDGIDFLKLLLVDEQGNKVVDKGFRTIGKQFSIDVIDLDADGEKDFVFLVREKDFNHIHKTLVIHRRVWKTDLKEILTMPYAGETDGGIKWKYKHSYFRQDDGNIHIKLTLEHDASNRTSSHLPVKTRWINIADRDVPHDLKESEPPNPMQWYCRKEEYFIPNLLGDKGYTIRANPKRGSYPSTRDPLRTIQVVDKDGSVVAERPFRAYFGGYRLALFDIDADGDKEFIFVLHTGSGTGYMFFEVSIDKIVGGQFIPLVTFPLGVAASQGEWGFTEWKYRGYNQDNPTEVAFEIILHYMTFPSYKEDGVPDSFPREDSIVLLFKKYEYIISSIYPSKSAKRPRDNWRKGDSWIFK